jgi:hypothetical protein
LFNHQTNQSGAVAIKILGYHVLLVNHSRELDIFPGLLPKCGHDLFLTLCSCPNPRCAATNALCVIILCHTIFSSCLVSMVITKGITEFISYFVLLLPYPVCLLLYYCSLSSLCESCNEWFLMHLFLIF